MAHRRRRSTRRRALRAGLILGLFMLPAGLIALLAPAAVPTQVENEEEAGGSASFRDLRFTKRPLLGRSDLGGSSLVDVESLFSGARLRGKEIRRRTSVLEARNQQPQETTIVLDEGGIEDFVENELFESADPSADPPTLEVDLTELWNEDVFDVIEPLLTRYGASRFDDFVGDGADVTLTSAPRQPFLVPEPAPGALVGFGLVLLAWARRAPIRSRS